MMSSRIREAGIRAALVAVIVILVMTGLVPAQHSSPNIVKASTWTPPAIAYPQVVGIPMWGIWAASYGTEDWNEYVTSSQHITLGDQGYLFLIGWSDYGGRAQIYINPADIHGETTLYDGTPALISIEGYQHVYAMGSWYEPSTGELYVVGYLFKQQGDEPMAFIMSVKPEDGMVNWATIILMGEASEALDVTFVGNEGALAVVGWIVEGGDRDALFMRINPGDGSLEQAFMLGDNSYNETATAVATNGTVEFIAVNAVKHDGENVTSTPSIVMADWGDIISTVFTNIGQAGYSVGLINDLEYFEEDGTGYLAAVGEVRNSDEQHGLIELLKVDASELIPQWAEYEVSGGRTIYYGVKWADEFSVAGSYYDPLSGAEKALLMAYDIMGENTFAAVLESSGDTSAVDAFFITEYGSRSFLFGGNAIGTAPVGESHTYNALGGNIWGVPYSLPEVCDPYTCDDEAMEYRARNIEGIERLQIRASTITSIPVQGKSVEGRAVIDRPEEQECIHYPILWLHLPNYVIVHTITTTYLYTYTMTQTDELTVTEVATCTVTSENTVTATSTETMTTTLTKEVPTITTVTQYVMVSDERTTYSVVGVGAVLGLLMIANLLRRR